MALAQRGFNPGEIDGNLDENAREALKSFQRDAQLEVTGTLNQATARELGVDLRGNERADFGASDRR
jgi:peptidoglycan hydrolase-like protein with peptidoglycan-binding domain